MRLSFRYYFFIGAFFCDLQTASGRWGPGLENRVGVEAIRSAIHVVLVSLWHGVLSWWKNTFSFSFVSVFVRFLSSDTTITLYNIRYWWFSLPEGNRWTKYFAYLKIQRPKPCLLIFASLIALDGFHLLLSIQLTADLTLKWSGESIFHPLSHIYAKSPFCCVETIANNALNRRRVVAFDRLWANAAQLSHCHTMVNTLPSDIFTFSAIPRNFNLRSAKMNLWSILVFSGTTAEFGCSASFVSVRPRLKSAYNRCFRRSRVRIILIKPLLCLNSIFPIRNQCFINTRNSDFSIVLKICNCSFT